MLAQVEVATIVDAFDLLEAERPTKVELDVERGAGVVRQLVLTVDVVLQPLGLEAQAQVPLHARGLPALEVLHVGARLDEELHLHLLELTRTENESPGRDLVAERLADLRNAERHLLPRRLLHVEEVHVRPLRRLRPQVDGRRRIFHGAHLRLEHQVELPRLSEITVRGLARLLRRLLATRGVRHLVGAEAALAGLAVDERIDEPTHVPGRLPHARVHEDRRVEPLDVVARADHRLPPLLLQVALERNAEWPVIPHRAQPAVDLGGLEDEAAPLAQRDEFFEDVRRVAHAGFRSRIWSRRVPTLT